MSHEPPIEPRKDDDERDTFGSFYQHERNELARGRALNPDTDELEDPFRERVRNALDLSHFTRDDQIIARIEQLVRDEVR